MNDERDNVNVTGPVRRSNVSPPMLPNCHLARVRTCRWTRRTRVPQTIETLASRCCKAHLRRGVLTVELVLTIPVLLALLLALVQFAITLSSQQSVSAAAHVGARQAMLPSSTADTVTAAVAQSVQGWHFQDNQEVVIEVNGEPESVRPLASAVTGDAISVEVRVPATEAAPDLLRFIGLSNEGKVIRSRFLVRRE